MVILNIQADRRVWSVLTGLTNLVEASFPMKCIINRRSQFSSSHRYWLDELSEPENIRLFGKCARAPGHGHNYVLNVSLESELDPYGMVLNLTEAKDIIRREVIEPLDFSYLNETWQAFQATLPTTENVARVIWQRLMPHLPLINIQLFETPDLWADYQGNGMEAYLTTSAHFSAAHRLALPDLSDEQILRSMANAPGLMVMAITIG